MVARARTLEVRRMRPSGIMAMTAAPVEVTADSRVAPESEDCFRKRKMATGMRMREFSLMIFWRVVKSSERESLIF